MQDSVHKVLIMSNWCRKKARFKVLWNLGLSLNRYSLTASLCHTSCLVSALSSHPPFVSNCILLYPPHILPLCRWCAYAKTPNWLWRTAPLTSWTCCQTPTSTCAPSYLAMRAKWRLWETTSTSGSLWRTSPRRPSRPSVCLRREKSACTKRTHSPGESRHNTPE